MQSPDPHHADDLPETASDDTAYDDTAYDDTAYDDAGHADWRTRLRTRTRMRTRGDVHSHADADDTAPDLVPERDVPSAPTTGDAVVDAAMVELAAAESGTLTERIDAAERAHRVLQGRLSDLGGA